MKVSATTVYINASACGAKHHSVWDVYILIIGITDKYGCNCFFSVGENKLKSDKSSFENNLRPTAEENKNNEAQHILPTKRDKKVAIKTKTFEAGKRY